jgi:hypothetical protein
LVVCFARAAAVLLLVLRNGRSAVLDRVLHLCRTLTLTTTLNKKNVAARAAALAANRTCDFKSTLYGTIVQLIKKMLDIGGLMKRMSGVRFSSLKTQNPNAKLLLAKFRKYSALHLASSWLGSPPPVDWVLLLLLIGFSSSC